MAINKFQRSKVKSKFTFDLSVNVTHIGVPSLFQNTVFLETTWQNELNSYFI